MEPPVGEKKCQLTALLVAPDRELAGQFRETLKVSQAFAILADLKTYPSRHTLEIRLKQLGPDLVLIDLASSREQAADLIRYLAESGAPLQVVGLSPRNDPGILLNCLRLGASEFLYAPFEIAAQQEAVSRLRRIRKAETAAPAPPGNVTVFCSAKPGCGASTVAAQAAFSLRKATGKRVLLADLDLAGGGIGYYARAGRPDLVFQALGGGGGLTPASWTGLVSSANGVDILAAPERPFTGAVESRQLNAFLEFARANYDSVLIDAPAVFERWTLALVSQADCALLVTTPELPSLHLARRAIRYLGRLGFPRDRVQVLLNRINRREELARAHLERLFECAVHSRLPNDFFSLNRLAALGEPLEESSDLGRAVAILASRLAGAAAPH